MCTPMTTKSKLTKDDKSSKENASQYRSMIGGLLYLTATKSNIMYVVCLASRFQQEPKEPHVVVVKKIQISKRNRIVWFVESQKFRFHSDNLYRCRLGWKC